MKAADKDKPIPAVPDGVWESSRPADEKNKSKGTATTDLQGNGYPQKQSK